MGVICSAHAMAPTCGARKISHGRKPANYVPNDDVIAVPVDAEVSFYEKHVADKVNNIPNKPGVQQQIRIWQENELMAQQYGLNTQSGAYYVPTSEEKFRWFQNSYMRYLKSAGEDPLKQIPGQTWRSWTANDEVNSIDQMEAVFKASTKRSPVTGRELPQPLQQQEAKAKKFKINFQPRIEQGLIIVSTTNAWFDARAWVAANGNSEFNIQRTFTSTNTRIFYNYYFLTGRYLASIDQPIGWGLSARMTSSWTPTLNNPNVERNHTAQLNYSVSF